MTTEVCRDPETCTLCQTFKTYKEETRPLPGKWDGAVMVGGSNGVYQESTTRGDEKRTEEKEPSQQSPVLELYFSGCQGKCTFFRLLLTLIDEYFSERDVNVIAMDYLKEKKRLLATSERLKLHKGP